MRDMRQMVAVGVIKAVEKKAATGGKNHQVCHESSQEVSGEIYSRTFWVRGSPGKPQLENNGSRRSLGLTCLLPERSLPEQS